MSTDNPMPLQHLHYFLGKQHEQNEKRVWMVIALTASMMVGEIVAGTGGLARHMERTVDTM